MVRTAQYQCWGDFKQRMKLNPYALLDLCDFHNTSLYSEEEMLLLNGYYVFALDGSGINVPTTVETVN
jgi:hypothetical protein